MRKASKTSRLIVAALGAVLSIAGIASIAALVHILSATSADGGLTVSGLRIDYLLIGLILGAFVIAGVSMIWSAARARRRDLVPGPTLYILSMALIMLGMQQVVLGTWINGAVLIVIGAGIGFLEHRSDVL